MAIDRSEYKIKITAEADTAAIQNTIGQLTKMRDAAAAAGKDVSLYDAAIDKSKATLAAAKKAQDEESGALEKSIASHRAAHEAIQLFSNATGGAFGPVAELAHFLANPYLLAMEGASLAIKMLIDRHNELKQATIESLKATQEMSDAFRDNLLKATLGANEQLAAYKDTLGHVLEQQDRISQSLQFNSQLVAANTSAIVEQAKAYEALANARIQSGVLAGVTSSPEAAHMQEEERRRARATQEQAEHDRVAFEVDTKRHDANAAQGESESADTAAQKAIKDKVTTTAAINDVTPILDSAKKQMEKLKAELDKAKDNAFAGQEVPTGVSQGEVELRALITDANEKVKFAQEQVKNQQGYIDQQTKHLSDLTVKSAQDDAEISRLTQRAEKMKELADETRRAAVEEERLQKVKEQGQTAVDATNDETARVQRRNAVQQKINAGTATPEERAEWTGANESGVGHAIADTNRRIGAIQNNVRFEGGHASADEVQQLVLLNARLIGLTENVHGVTAHNTSDIAAQERRISQLEQRTGNARMYSN